MLALAGMLRPEAWLLTGLYFLWMAWPATWPQRFRYAALAAIGPLVWAGTDWIVTGDPLFSLHLHELLGGGARAPAHAVGAAVGRAAVLREHRQDCRC